MTSFGTFWLLTVVFGSDTAASRLALGKVIFKLEIVDLSVGFDPSDGGSALGKLSFRLGTDACVVLSDLGDF